MLNIAVCSDKADCHGRGSSGCILIQGLGPTLSWLCLIRLAHDEATSDLMNIRQTHCSLCFTALYWTQERSIEGDKINAKYFPVPTGQERSLVQTLVVHQMVVCARTEAMRPAVRTSSWQLVCISPTALPHPRPRTAKRNRLRCSAALTDQRTPKVVRLQAEEATPANFSAYGQARRSPDLFCNSNAGTVFPFVSACGAGHRSHRRR